MKFKELTAPTLTAINRTDTLVVIPIAAVEQHGPHMPTGTDTILCTSVADELEQRLSDQVLLTPTMWLGASSHHLRFGATLNAELDTHVSMLCDVARSLLEDGYRRVLFLNGHGGNVDPMKIAVRELQPSYTDALIAAGCYWSVAAAEREKILEGDHKFVGHACEFETSLMLHVRPELVDREKLADAGELVTDDINGVYLSRDMAQRTKQGCTGRPDLATPEKGKQLFDAIVENLAETAKKLLAEPLTADYKDFL